MRHELLTSITADHPGQHPNKKSGHKAALFSFPTKPNSPTGTPIDILINNAGFGYLGHFQAGTPAWDRKMVDVNCATVVHLTHLFPPRMIERRHGYIMMLASAARPSLGNQPRSVTISLF